jgi:hypothetical protein
MTALLLLVLVGVLLVVVGLCRIAGMGSRAEERRERALREANRKWRGR